MGATVAAAVGGIVGIAVGVMVGWSVQGDPSGVRVVTELKQAA